MKPSHARLVAMGIVLGGLTGCASPRMMGNAPGPRPPNEAATVTLPEHVAQPPDILLVQMEATASLDSKIRTGDSVGVSIRNAIPDQPFGAVLPVPENGVLDLSPYGMYAIDGKSAAQRSGS